MPVKKNRSEELAKQVKANRLRGKKTRVVTGNKTYDEKTRMKICIRLRDEGLSINQLSKQTGIPWSTIKQWNEKYADTLLEQFKNHPAKIVGFTEKEIVEVRTELKDRKEKVLQEAIDTQLIIINKIRQNVEENPKISTRDLAYSSDVMNKIITMGKEELPPAEEKKRTFGLMEDIMKMYTNNAENAKIESNE